MINPKPIEQAKTPELALALPALRRARKRAEEIAIATNTALIQVEDGQVVRVLPRAHGERSAALQERLRLIERDEAAADTPKSAAVAANEPKLSVDEALVAGLTPPPGVGPVTLQDMDRAIADGASDGKHASTASLLGLMKDDPDLVDQVCSIAYEARRSAHLRAVDE